MSSTLTNDENEMEKYMNVKKIGRDGAKDDAPKRAALGELQNRALPRAAIGKYAAQKTLKDAELGPAARTEKPRVNSHWKKGELPTTMTTKSPTKTTTTVTSTKAAAKLSASKVLTRSSSLRLNVTKKAPTTLTLAANDIQRKGALAVQSKEIKTVNTKSSKEKLQSIETNLRREDSKLKAALAREVKIGPVAPKNNAVPIKSDVQTESDEVKEAQYVAIKTVDSYTYSNRLIKKDVRNIDEGDEESLILVSDYVNDIYEYLFQLENEQPVIKRHLANQQVVTPKMRAVLLDWVNEVHSQFHLVTETFHMTVGIIDRYLQKVPYTMRSLLQLVGATALFLASKYEERFPPAIADLIYMTDHSYNQKQILEMEIQIFRTLDCNLARPVSIHFLRRFSKAADIGDFQHAMSKYFLELAAIEYELASYKPSETAAASLFLSLHMSRGDPNIASGFNDSHWNATLQYYSHYTAKHLRPITRKIASVARRAPEATLNAVYTKYQSPKLYKVSMHPVLYSALMDSLIENNF